MPETISDRITVLKQELKVSSDRELEKGRDNSDKWVISNGLLDTWKEKDPAKFSTSKLEVFLNYWGVNKEWFKTGKGEVLIKNSTPAINSTDNTEMEVNSIYQDLVEARSDYRLIPKTILDGEYRMVLKSEIDEKTELLREALAAKNELLDEYRALTKQLKSEIEQLRSQPVVHPQAT
jgi:hypothetical protein